MRVLALPRDEMAGIINGLTNLNLEPQQVLGDRTNVQNAIRKAKEEVDLQKNAGSDGANPIVLSSDSESKDTVPMRFQPPKAVRLGDLSRRASTATDNQTLARLVKEFVEVLRMNSSRTLTKEAFMFLDVLYKQLDNPSVFIQPARFVNFVYHGLNAVPDERDIRPSRERSFNELVPEKEPAHIKLGVVARLRREVGYSQNNKKLAAMIADFAQVTNKSTGRTVTKVCDSQMPRSHTIFLCFLGRVCFLGRSIRTPHSHAVIFLPLMYGHFTKLEEEGPPVSIHRICSLEYFVGVGCGKVRSLRSP